jgi:antitoxin (DNA-binding transcriptional repressor) of toxin-antitoxin stability system
MKTITTLEFRKNAEGVLRRIAKGERLMLSHCGKPAVRLEPLTNAALWGTRIDGHHGTAVRLPQSLAAKRRQFLTTDYVVDEKGLDTEVVNRAQTDGQTVLREVLDFA